MPRRNPGVETAIGVRPARDRLWTTLGGAEDEEGQDGLAAGLLEWAGPLRYPPTAGPREARVTGSADDRACPEGALPAGRRTSLERFSTTFRSRTGFRAAVLISVLAALLSGFFWWQVATGMPEAVPLSEVSVPATDQPPAYGDGVVATATEPVPEPGPDPEPAAGTGAGAGPGTVIVHVAGAVARPGIVQLAPGSRLHEAIAAAGGGTAVADPDRLNLASVLEDGQKVLVPARGDPAAAEPVPGETEGVSGNSPGRSGPDGGRRIDLNTAGVEELGTLPRIGPVLAQRIVDWRKQHGRFKTVEELDAVDGVGPKLLEALLPLVRV